MSEDYWVMANREYRQRQARQRYAFSVDCIRIIENKLKEPLTPDWREFYNREQEKNREYLIEAAELYKKQFGDYPDGYEATWPKSAS